MAKSGFVSRMLNFIGLEETTVDSDDYYDDEEEYLPSEIETAPPSIKARRGKVVSMPGGQSPMKMMVYQPSNSDDTQAIIDNIRAHKPVIINLEAQDVDVSQRILDYVSGGVYALGGSIYKVSRGIFVLAPQNVDVNGNMQDDMRTGSRSFFAMGGTRRD